MVFGFGEGKIEIFLDKTSFSFGENIHGKIKLGLKKEKQARKLKLVLQGTEERTQFGPTGFGGVAMGKGIRTSRTSIGPVSRTKQSVVIFANETIIDGEKLYPIGEKEYEFTIQAPKESAVPKMPEGTLGNIVGAMQTLSGASRRIKWEIKASLDVPGKDISKGIQISIG